MAYVKLDCGILDSTIWMDRAARELFITALLMAIPEETAEPSRQIEIDSLNETGFEVPPGWYGKVHAAGSGIIRRAGIELDIGMEALKRLGSPDKESRTPDFEGRRMIRIDGGFLILNFDKYRRKDYTSAERSRRWRERKRHTVADAPTRVSSRSNTQAEAEAEAEAEALVHKSTLHRIDADFDLFWKAYPRKVGKKAALKKFTLALKSTTLEKMLSAIEAQKHSESWQKDGGQFIPHPVTWLNQGRWDDEVSMRADVHQSTSKLHQMTNQELLLQSLQ